MGWEGYFTSGWHIETPSGARLLHQPFLEGRLERVGFSPWSTLNLRLLQLAFETGCGLT